MGGHKRAIGGALMGVWDIMGLSNDAKKWQKLATDKSLSHKDKAIYQNYADIANRALKAYLLRWEAACELRDKEKNGKCS